MTDSFLSPVYMISVGGIWRMLMYSNCTLGNVRIDERDQRV